MEPTSLKKAKVDTVSVADVMRNKAVKLMRIVKAQKASGCLPTRAAIAARSPVATCIYGAKKG